MDVVHQGWKLVQIKFSMKAHRPFIGLMSNKLVSHKNCHLLQIESAKIKNRIVLAIYILLTIIIFVSGKILWNMTNEYHDVWRKQILVQFIFLVLLSTTEIQLALKHSVPCLAYSTCYYSSSLYYSYYFQCFYHIMSACFISVSFFLLICLHSKF